MIVNFVDDFSNRLEACFIASLRNVHNLTFRFIKDIFNVVILFLCQSNDVRRGSDQLPQARFCRHDFGIISRISGRRNRVGQFRQVSNAAGIIQLIFSLQRRFHSQDINRLIGIVQFNHRLKQNLMLTTVKIVRLNLFHDIGQGFMIQENRTQNRFFGTNILGRHVAG